MMKTGKNIAKFVTSQRGGKLLEFDGYLLSINRRMEKRQHWRCRVQNCGVTAVTDEDLVIKTPGLHNHAPDYKNIEIKKTLNNVKEEAIKQPFKPIKRLFSDAFGDALANPDETTMDSLPSFNKYRCTLYRARSKRLPNIPHSRSEIDLQGQWTQTKDGRPFLLANDGAEDRILIFGTAQNLRYLCLATEIFMDGTFKSAPEMFTQVYSIHVKVMECMVPVVVALLPKRDTQTYRRMFQLLQQAAERFGHRLQPQTVCIDFEKAMIECVNQLFPSSRIRGCLFHFTQAIWRKVQALGLTNKYTENQSFNRLVRRSSALPLIPLESVDEVWMEALNELTDEDVIPFMDYVTTTWVDTSAAIFPKEMWNHFDNIDGFRTNNHLEAWHGVLNRELGRPHPNIYKLIELLQTKQQEVEHKLRLLQSGGLNPPQKQKYRDVTDRLVRLKTRLQNREIAVYDYAGAVAGALKQGVIRG